MSETTPSQRLYSAASALSIQSVAALFAADPTRAETLRCEAAGLDLDFSKQRLDHNALEALLALAESADLSGAYAELISGAELNITEQRAVLHTLLRGTAADALPHLYSDVQNTLTAMRTLVENVHQGNHRGFTNAQLTDVVNIGIGGSDLGPRMVCQALADPNVPLRAHFVANVDPQDLDDVLAPLDPATTLFVICSKTFTTEETLSNATRARAWLMAAGAQESDIAKHMVAVTSRVERAVAFGIASECCYPLWDWVGGRYSLWSAIGLSIALNQGWDAFHQLLEGAHALDIHTRDNRGASNLPLMMALLEYWNTQFCGVDSHVVLPYAQRLVALPDFLQQLTMESNGKRVDLQGNALAQQSAPLLWGSAGTIGQHSYYQLLHQGTRRFSADIILPLTNGDVDQDAHRKLAANALAQSRALMIGRSPSEAQALCQQRQQEPSLATHLEMPGNHPHSLLLFDQVDPWHLGALIAAYEHKTFFLSRLLNINAFDQWGVELGKEIGRQVDDCLLSGEGLEQLDASTARAARAWRARN